MTKGDFAYAGEAFDKAVAISPAFGRAHAVKSMLYTSMAQHAWETHGPQFRDLAAPAAMDAVALDPYSSFSHMAAGCVAMLDRDAAGASKAFDRAVELAPNCTMSHIARARAESLAGNHARAAESLRKIEVLSPAETNLDFNLTNKVLVGLGAGDFESAAADARAIVARRDALPQSSGIAIAALGLVRSNGEAKRAAEAHMRAYPEWDRRKLLASLSPIAAALSETMVEGLSEAGLR